MPTPRRDDVLAAITTMTDESGFAPTTRELADRLGMWHSSVYRVLLRLRDEGCVSWEEGRARTLAVHQPPLTSPTTPGPSA